MNDKIHIDISQIPDCYRESLARGAIELTKQVFSMPGAEERYQEWLKKRRAKEKGEVAAAQEQTEE